MGLDLHYGLLGSTNFFNFGQGAAQMEDSGWEGRKGDADIRWHAPGVRIIIAVDPPRLTSSSRPRRSRGRSPLTSVEQL